MKRLSDGRHRLFWAALILAFVKLLSSAPVSAQEAEQPPREAVLLFNDAVGLQNNGAFKAAVEAWDKFLTRYPKTSLSLKGHYYHGVCLIQEKNLEKAVEELELVINGDKTFPSREDAYLSLATTYSSLAQAEKPGMYELAAARFGALAEEFPKGKYADEAFYFQGESLFALDKKAEAIAAYNKVVTDYPESKRRGESLYAMGATQEEVGDFAAAGATYDIFLKEFADHELADEVRMRKAETLLQGGQVDEAAKLFQQVAAVPDFAFADHATFRQGECLFRQEKFAAAGDLFAAVATKFPQSTYAVEATMRAGQAYYRAADADSKAAEWLDKVIAAGGKDAVEAAHWRCRIHLRSGQAAEAAALATKSLPQAAESPFLPELLLDQADGLYQDAGRRAESLPIYLEIFTKYPDHAQAPQALYNAAYTAMDLEKHAEALKHADAFVEKFPDHNLLLDTKYVAAESQLRLGKYAESEQLYSELIAAAAGRPELEAWQLRLGMALYLQDKRKEVVEFLAPLLPGFKEADNKAEGQFLVGTSQLFLEQYEAAVTALEASLAANPTWSQADETWLNLSRAQRKLNQLPAAIASVKKLLDGFPQSKLLDRAHFRLGEYSSAAGDHATAITEFGTVLENWPDSALKPYALSGKGWAQLHSKKYAEAAEIFTTLIDNHAGHELIPTALRARATCLYQTGDFAAGIADVNKYLESKPDVDDRVEALYVRGMCEVGAKKFDDAATTFETILTDKPEYENAARVLYELGWTCKSGGKPAEAVKAFTRLTTEHPDSPLAAEASYHVGEDLYGSQKFAEAVKSYTASRDKAGTADLKEKAAYKLGWANFQLKKFEEALAAFGEQVSDHPQGKLYADGLFMQGECQFKLGQFAEAFGHLREVPKVDRLLRTKSRSSSGSTGDKVPHKRKQWQQAVDLLATIPEDFPDSEYVPEALYEQGWAKQNLNEADAARTLYAEAAEKSRAAVGARACSCWANSISRTSSTTRRSSCFSERCSVFGAIRSPTT